jgi:hypothetical protein
MTTPIPDLPPTRTPDPTADLHALADLLVHVLKTVARDEAHVDELLADPVLFVTLNAPSTAYVVGPGGVVLDSVPSDQLPPAALQAVARFVEGCFQQMDEADRRAAYEAIQQGAEPVVSFRAHTGHARLLLQGDGAPVELVALHAAEPVTH